MTLRIIAFILLTLLGYSTPVWVFVPAVGLYIAIWRGYELLILSAFIDAQFGQGGLLFGYVYTLSVGLILLVAELLKPRLRLYNSR